MGIKTAKRTYKLKIFKCITYFEFSDIMFEKAMVPNASEHLHNGLLPKVWSSVRMNFKKKLRNKEITVNNK